MTLWSWIWYNQVRSNIKTDLINIFCLPNVSQLLCWSMPDPTFPACWSRCQSCTSWVIYLCSCSFHIYSILLASHLYSGWLSYWSREPHCTGLCHNPENPPYCCVDGYGYHIYLPIYYQVISSYDFLGIFVSSHTDSVMYVSHELTLPVVVKYWQKHDLHVGGLGFCLRGTYLLSISHIWRVQSYLLHFIVD